MAAAALIWFALRRISYVRTQAVMIALTIAFVVASFTWTPPEHWVKNPILGHLPGILLAALALEIAEAAIMLRKFAEKEREARGEK